jgi:hypothetical protein
MLSASSIVRSSLLMAAIVAPILGACATSTLDAVTEGAPDAAIGEDGSARADTGNIVENDATTGDDQSAPDDTGASDKDTATGDDDSGDDAGNSGDAGDWINMTNNATGCDHHAGVACGWAASNNGVGYVCACRHGDWADGWTCDAKSAPTVAGASCPGVVTTDAGTDSGTVTDSGIIDSGTTKDTGTTADGGSTGWVDMSNNPAGCDSKNGTPCGWNATNNNTGFSCACRRGDWADGWTCEKTGSATIPGPACPDAGP